MRTLGQGVRGSTPLSRHARDKHDKRFAKFVIHGYFVYYTLPFGWEVGAYAYHITGLLATSYIIILGVHPIPDTSVIVVQARL